MNTNKISFIKGINPLRCIAALGIILYHSSIGLTEKFPDFLKLLIKNLPVCVDFFFIISGFLIVYLLLNEKERKGNISVKNFYVRRALRILPLYYLILGLIMMIALQSVWALVHSFKFMYAETRLNNAFSDLSSISKASVQ